MKINIEKSLLELTPENEEEAEKLTELWRLIVDCVKFNKKLVPVGEYLPPHSSVARFSIEE